MRYWSRFASVLGGRRILLALGGLYIVIAIGRAIRHLMLGTPARPIIVITSFIGGSGLIVLLGGYWLPETDIHSEFQTTIAGWCLGGIGVMLAILVLYHVQPDTDLPEPNRLLPILTGFSAVAGFGVGTYAAQAKTTALELERRNQELQQIQTHLEESNKRLEQFAYAASHDLQEPSRMVSTYLQLIENRYRDDLDEDGEEFLEFAINGADRMNAMIESLLEYSRIESQGDSLEPIDLDDVLADSRKDLELQIEETDADVTAEKLPRVKGDEHQLRRLFRNLISNAIEYSGDEPPVVHVSAERNGEEWVVSVRDEGIGIDPDDQDRIFEVFQRLHSHEEHRGTGIGLALCKRIVERHGGDIWVESAPGEGSVFSFTLSPTVERDDDSMSEPVSA